MDSFRPRISQHHLLAFLLLLVCFAAFFRIYSRIKITLLGYEIGRMREIEEQLLKKRSLLTMEYAKVTTRSYLEEKAKKSGQLKQMNVPLADHQ